MGKPMALVKQQLENVLKKHIDVTMPVSNVSLNNEKFLSQVTPLLKRTADECRESNLACNLTDESFVVALSNEVRIEVNFRRCFWTAYYDESSQKRVLLVKFFVCNEAYWSTALQIRRRKLEESVNVLEDLIFAGSNKPFLEELKTRVQKSQKDEMVKDLHIENVKALIEATLSGLKMKRRIEYRKYYAAVIVKLDDKRDAEFRVPYGSKAGETLMKIPDWAKKLSEALADIKVDVAMMPGEKNYTWEE